MFVIEDTNTLFALDTNLNDIYIGRNLFYQISSFLFLFFPGLISANVDIKTRVRRPRKGMCRKKMSLTTSSLAATVVYI